jgi:hypothetical protein
MRIRKMHLAVVYCMIFCLLTGFIVADTGYAVSVAAVKELYVDPVYGDDGNSGSIAAPFQSVDKARKAVRLLNANMDADIRVYLRGGTYPLIETIAFTDQDSGKNGHQVIYQAYPGEKPVLSGEKSLTGWELHDSAKQIYKASAGENIETRQLYINGVRATRARSESGLPDATHDNNGLTTTMTEMANWGNISDIEMVFNQMWTNPRGGVDSITVSGGKSVIKMKQPGWYYMRSKGSTSATVPWYYENAYELLDQEGEWYLDRTTDTFYYKPRAGEEITTAHVVAPVLEQLVTLTGSSPDQPVSNIRFEGISFQYTTWLRPSTGAGLSDAQSNVLREKDPVTGITTETIIPAAVQIEKGKSITFERCSFSHLGSSGINIMDASQDNLVQGSSFVDLSGSGVQVGEVDMRDPENYNPLDSRQVLKNNDVLNSFFFQIGVEYRSSVAIFAAYPQDMDISHNEIANVPYSGITVGWGWGDVDTSNRGNRIQNNYIHHVMMELIDGGAIYTLGTSYDLHISGNYIKEQKHNFGAIYLDQGSSNIKVKDNVIEMVQIPIFMNPSTNNVVENTYTDNIKKVDNGTGNEIKGTVYVPDGNWPDAAKAIIQHAGIEPAYVDMIPDVPELEPSVRPTPEPLPPVLPLEFTGKSGFITSITKTGKLRSDWGGWVGMKITVGNAPIVVTALGRVHLSDSMGIHRMKIVDASTSADLPGSLVYLNMLDAQANGDFKYVQLPSSVTLEANKTYYVVSEEKVGEDLWYDSDLIVTSTAVADVKIGVWSSTYREGDSGGKSFVGVDFLYENGTSSTPAPVRLPEPVAEEPAQEPVQLPVELETTLGYVQSLAQGTLRNDWTGWAGMRLTVGNAPISVTALGRMFIQGNSEAHLVRIVEAESKAVLAEANVQMKGGMSGQFQYAQLFEPVRLQPGKTYYMLSQETFGGDYWLDGNSVATTSNLGTIDGSSFKSNDFSPRVNNYLDGPLIGNSFVGLDFRYTTDDTVLSNLLNNGGFEYNTASWSGSNATVTRVVQGTYNQSAGSAKVTMTNTFGAATQKVILEKNKKYDISVWVKLTSGTDVAQIILDHGTGTPRYGYLAANTPVDTTWRQLKMSYKYSGTNDNANATVQIRIGSGSTKLTYYFDDFIIKEATDQVINGGFEQNTSGWTAYNSTVARVTDATYGASAGSAKVTMTNPFGAAMQRVTLKKNVKYEISVWVKLSSGTNVAQIILEHGSGTPKYEYLAANTPVDTTWRQLKASYEYKGSHDNGDAVIQLRIGDGSTKYTYYFDDFIAAPVVIDQVDMQISDTILRQGAQGSLVLTGTMWNGETADLSRAQISFRSGNASVVEATYDYTVGGAVYGKLLGKLDGVASVKARVTFNGKTVETSPIAIQVDGVAPVTQATVEGVQAGSLYRSDVKIRFTATDSRAGVEAVRYSLDQGVTWNVYTDPVVLTADGAYTIQYYATDLAGNAEAVKTVSFNLDSTAPTIVAFVPGEDGIYDDSGDLTPQFTVTDNLSGVDNSKTTAALDTTSYQFGTTTPLYTLPLGPHTFIVTASDLASNQGSRTVHFQTVTSINSLKALVTRFTNNNWIDNVGIANSLQAKLANNDLNSFVNEVQAQSGKHISSEAAKYLLRDARFLLSQH